MCIHHGIEIPPPVTYEYVRFVKFQGNDAALDLGEIGESNEE
jgi:hypothetical protein